MRIILLIINLLVLTLALTTGFFLFIAIAAVVTGFVIYFIVKQKLTGSQPDFMQVYTFSQTTETPPSAAIEVEYHEVKEIKKE